MNSIVAVVCLLALVNAEVCVDTSECQSTFCGADYSVLCDNSRCTCEPDGNSTIAAPVVPNGPIVGIDACFSKTDCAGSCGTVVVLTPTTAEAHHHHHPEPEHHHPELPNPDEHHHHHEGPVKAPLEMHCLDGTCMCVHV